MDVHTETKHLAAFVDKMEKEGLGGIVADTFVHYYRQVLSGHTGTISDREIAPVSDREVQSVDQLAGYAQAGRQMLDRTVMIVLNGGLGTSMGLTGPKSLLPVKDGKSFLELTLGHAQQRNVRLAFMNSFSTHTDTIAAIERAAPSVAPIYFLQHKFPKILQEDLSPAVCPEHPNLEWNPPGHGDIYIALHTSGMLQKLLDQGISYAFIANSDNLGATVDERLLGYFAEHRLPFMMEVAERTPADTKGGHLARHRNGRLLLREIAQCPRAEIDAFQDIRRYRFFNTNCLWVNLSALNHLIRTAHMVRLPMILNPKTLDPRNPESPAVYQVETAMGSAISLFDGATAVKIPPSRFFPVKKCNELLAVRSDCYLLSETHRLTANPQRALGPITIDLDPKYYGNIDMFQQRFAAGVPSLVGCTALEISGDVFFEENVTIAGKVKIVNSKPGRAVVKKGTRIDADVHF